VGAVIRKYSIDELPQLINVLKGNMSLVGPRPLPVSPQEFTPDAHLRHVVAPGITGLWQVLGVHLRPLLEQGPGALDDVTALWRVRDSNTAGYGDMLDVDLAYLTSHTIGMDLQLLLRTLPALIVRRATY